MRLGGEVDDGVALPGQLLHARLVGDVGVHEAVAVAGRGIVSERGQVGRVAGVGQLVDHDDAVVGGRQATVDEGRADETGAASDEDPHGPSLAAGSR